jgi:hypothetical protein
VRLLGLRYGDPRVTDSSEKGKPVERRGRKATGLKERGSYDGGAATIAD